MPYETWQHSSSTINARKNDNILYAESAGLIDPYTKRAFRKYNVVTYKTGDPNVETDIEIEDITEQEQKQQEDDENEMSDDDDSEILYAYDYKGNLMDKHGRHINVPRNQQKNKLNPNPPPQIDRNQQNKNYNGQKNSGSKNKLYTQSSDEMIEDNGVLPEKINYNPKQNTQSNLNRPSNMDQNTKMKTIKQVSALKNKLPSPKKRIVEQNLLDFDIPETEAEEIKPLEKKSYKKTIDLDDFLNDDSNQEITNQAQKSNKKGIGSDLIKFLDEDDGKKMTSSSKKNEMIDFLEEQKKSNKKSDTKTIIQSDKKSDRKSDKKLDIQSNKKSDRKSDTKKKLQAPTAKSLNIKPYVSTYKYSTSNPQLLSIYLTLERLSFYTKEFFEHLARNRTIRDSNDILYWKNRTFNVVTKGLGHLMRSLDFQPVEVLNLFNIYIREEMFEKFMNVGTKLFEKAKHQQINVYFEKLKVQLIQNINNYDNNDQSNRLLELILFCSMLMFKQIISLDKTIYDLSVIGIPPGSEFLSHMHCAQNRTVYYVENTEIPGIVNLETSEIMQKASVTLLKKKTVDNEYNCEDSDAVISKASKQYSNSGKLIDIDWSMDTTIAPYVSMLHNLLLELSEILDDLFEEMSHIFKDQKKVNQAHMMLKKQMTHGILKIVEQLDMKQLSDDDAIQSIDQILKKMSDYPALFGEFSKIKNKSIKQLSVSLESKVIEAISGISLNQTIDYASFSRKIEMVSYISVLIYYCLKTSSPRLGIIFADEGEEFKPHYHSSDYYKNPQLISEILVPGLINKNTKKVLLKARVRLQ